MQEILAGWGPANSAGSSGCHARRKFEEFQEFAGNSEIRSTRSFLLAGIKTRVLCVCASLYSARPWQIRVGFSEQ